MKYPMSKLRERTYGRGCKVGDVLILLGMSEYRVVGPHREGGIAVCFGPPENPCVQTRGIGFDAEQSPPKNWKHEDGANVDPVLLETEVTMLERLVDFLTARGHNVAAADVVTLFRTGSGAV